MEEGEGRPQIFLPLLFGGVAKKCSDRSVFARYTYSKIRWGVAPPHARGALRGENRWEGGHGEASAAQ